MKQTLELTGSIVALATPMHADGAVDWQALTQLVEWHIQNQTHGIVAVGTTGESATLNGAEHLKVIESVIRTTAGRVPVIAGTGANSTQEAVELTQEAKRLGADAALLVVPYYNKPPQRGIVAHYQKLAESVDLPQILYNVPGRTALDMSNETVLELADLDNIVAIKDATGDVARGKELIEKLDGRMSVLSGDDVTALQLMKHGAKGNISVTANVAPLQMSKVFAAALAQDFETAEQLHAPLEQLHTAMFLEPNPLPVKYALSRMGMCSTGIRLPLVWMDQKYNQQVDAALKAVGAI